MLALLKKDFFVLRKTCMLYMGIMLFYIALGVLNGNIAMFQVMIVLTALLLPITSMSYDERASWNKYGMSLPLRRRTIVLSKYAFAAAATGISVAFSAAVVAVYAVLRHEALTVDVLIHPAVFACLGLIIMDIGLPIVFWLGSEKGRYAVTALIWAIALAPMVLKKAFAIDVYDAALELFAALNGESLFLLLLAGTAVLTAGSILLSAAIFERKELA